MKRYENQLIHGPEKRTRAAAPWTVKMAPRGRLFFLSKDAFLGFSMFCKTVERIKICKFAEHCKAWMICVLFAIPILCYTRWLITLYIPYPKRTDRVCISTLFADDCKRVKNECLCLLRVCLSLSPSSERGGDSSPPSPSPKMWAHRCG